MAARLVSPRRASKPRLVWGLGGTSIAHRPGPAKVCNARNQDPNVVKAHQHILWLEVPMDDAMLMQVAETKRNAMGD